MIEKSRLRHLSTQKNSSSVTGVDLLLKGRIRCNGIDSLSNKLATSAHEPIISSTRGYSLRVGFNDDEASENENNSSNIHCGGV